MKLAHIFIIGSFLIIGCWDLNPSSSTDEQVNINGKGNRNLMKDQVASSVSQEEMIIPAPLRTLTIIFSTGAFVERLVEINDFLKNYCATGIDFAKEEADQNMQLATINEQLNTPRLSPIITLLPYTQNDDEPYGARSILGNISGITIVSQKAYKDVTSDPSGDTYINPAGWETVAARGSSFIAVMPKDYLIKEQFTDVEQLRIRAAIGRILSKLNLFLLVINQRWADAISQNTPCSDQAGTSGPQK